MAPRSKKTTTPVVAKSAPDVGWIKTTGWASIGNALIGRLSEMQALCQSATMAAIDVIAQDISKVNLRIGRIVGKDFTAFAPGEHPWAFRLALDPNEFHQWREVLALVVSHLVLRQDAYLLKKRQNITDITPDLIPITTKYVEQRVSGGEFVYDITAEDQGQTLLFGFNHAVLTKNDLMHIRFRVWNGYSGMSTLKIGMNVFGLNEMLTEFQAALTKSGTRPGSTITVPETLDDAQFERLKRELKEAYERAAKTGMPLILEQGAKLEKLSFNAAEMDMVRAKTQLHQEVARLFRMPPYKIGLLESVKAENLGAMEQAYVDDTLVPVCRAIETTLTAALLSQEDRLAGTCFMLDRHELYNRDPATQLQRVVEAYKAGVVRRNQALAALGFPAVDKKLDTFSVPVNTAILHLDGTIEFVTPNQAQPGSAAAPAADPAPKG